MKVKTDATKRCYNNKRSKIIDNIKKYRKKVLAEIVKLNK